MKAFRPTFSMPEAFLGAFLLLSGCGAGPGAAPPGRDGPEAAAKPSPARPAASPALDWRAASGLGLEQRSRGDLQGAWKSFLLAASLHPGRADVQQALRETEEALYLRRLAEAKSLLAEGKTRKACQRLREAVKLDRIAATVIEAQRLLRRNGYEPYGGQWLSRDEIARREKREERLAEVRRGELGLAGRGFVLDRRGHIRIFTDGTRGEALPFTRKLHGFLASIERTYALLFLPLLEEGAGSFPPGAPGGIDVVVYRRRGDYETMTGSKNTVGMFLPELHASVFFIGSQKFEDIVAVLLHEVCHQLDDKILAMRFPPPWLQEGLAVYFEGAEVSPRGTIERLGRMAPPQAVRICGALAEGGGRWWGVERLAGVERVSDIETAGEVYDFYAQSALLVSALLDDPARSRELFFKLVEEARRPQTRPRDALRDLRKVLAECGESTAGLDARLRHAAASLCGRDGRD